MGIVSVLQDKKVLVTYHATIDYTTRKCTVHLKC